MIIIEKGIPMPAPARLGTGKASKLLEMEVGDSVYLEEYTSSQANGITYKARKAGYKFTIRKEETGVRIWRVS